MAGVPGLPASRITTERFSMDRMPDGPARQVLTGRGIGVNPVYEPAMADYPQKLKPAVVRWVRPGWYAPYSTHTTVTGGVIYYIPIFVEETTTYIRIGIHVTTAMVGTADLRIFSWRDGIPHSLILSAGVVDTGTIGEKEIIISQTLNRGYYFLANRCTSSPALIGISGGSAPVAGIGMFLGNVEGNVILTVSAAYANPAPVPTGATGIRFATVQLREN
ncbi:MAG: hypothetical protein DDT23_01263 [candidate division WS2 bacterium]|nr:hypothetical protein [Candidatus Lithacetigena glycinireducens]